MAGYMPINFAGHPGYGTPGYAQMGNQAPMIPPVPMELPKTLIRYGEQTLWSSQFVAAGSALAAQDFRLFAVAVGNTGQGFANAVSIAETNLKEASRIPQAIAFDAFGVALQVEFGGSTDGANLNVAAAAPAIVGNLINVLNNCVVSWSFTQTEVDLAPAMLVGAGGGAFGAVSTTQNATETGHMNNGPGAVWLYRNHPVSLPAATTFAIRLRFGTRAAAQSASNYMVLRVVLLGFYKNAIEVG